MIHVTFHAQEIMTDQVVQPAQMRAFLENKAAKRRARNEKLRLQAVKDADAIITMIIEQYNPKTIYQWGSVLKSNAFSSISDIDIAVEGLNSAENFFALVNKADEMTQFPVDIVEIEHVVPEYLALIKKYGVCRYRRDNS